jgi:alpha-L-rhamnosidase
LGDWAPVKSKTPVELTSSVYYYVDVNILAKAAKILGKNDDYLKYAALAGRIKDAINTKYLNLKTGVYADGHQTEQSVPLCWGIVPDSLKNKAAAILADSVAANNYHLDIGILGAKAILNALSENGQAQTAYRLAVQDTYPSWGWWIVNGATTLYENWNMNAKRDLSLNHIMFGEISAWFYKALGGIKPDENTPGFKNVMIAPNFPEGLNNFEAVHNGPYGKIISSWARKGKKIKYKLLIPANSTASVSFPANSIKKVRLAGKPLDFTTSYHVVAGSYEFDIRQE